MDKLNSHITISYDINFIKIYLKDGFYVNCTIGDDYDISKSRSALETAAFVFDQIDKTPHVDLMIYFNKLKISNNRKVNIHKLIKNTHDKLLTIDTIKKYINLLF
jgi:hypothetical protein